ncbi:MAG: YDG domain-containing protein [Candidatus Paceibacterota bacterium]
MKERIIQTSTLLAIAALFVAGFFAPNFALADATVNPASGGTDISIDTSSASSGGGTFTELSGPSINESAPGEIAEGTHVFTLPEGWEFDTSSSVTVLRTAGDIQPSSQTAVLTSNTLTFTIDQASTEKSSLAFVLDSMKVRPTGTSPSNDKITYSGDGILGVTPGEEGTSLGTLSTVPGEVAQLAFEVQPGGAVYGSLLSPQPVVKTQDQFGNDSTSGLAETELVSLSLTGTGALVGTTELNIGMGGGNGTVTFTDLTADSVGTGNELTASSAGLNSAVSDPFDITPKALTATATVNEKDYDGNNSATIDTITLEGVVSWDGTPDDVTVDSNGTATFDSVNAGTHPVSVTGTTITGVDSDNYTLAEGDVNGEGVINPKPITVTANPQNKTYGNAEPDFTYEITTGSLVQGDELTGSLSRDAGENVGTHTITQGDLDNSNYGITFVSDNLTITERAITVSAVTDTKTYDGTTDSAATPIIMVGTLASGDSAGFTQTYDNKNVGTGKTLTPAGSVNDGNNGDNYNVAFVNDETGVITEKELTISGLSAADKTYDGTTDADVTGTPALVGVESGDDVSLTGTATGAFVTANAGDSIDVTVLGFDITGAGVGNYLLTQPTLGANIDPLGVTGSFTTENKVYNGNTTATVLTQSLDGVLLGDEESVILTGGTADFADPNVSEAIVVTASGMTLGGSAEENYNLTSVGTEIADITPKLLTATVTVQKKVYNGDDSATIIGVNFGGVVDGETVIADFTSATATFADAEIGAGKEVTASGITISSGNESGNYSYDGTATGTGEILAVPTTVYVNDSWTDTVAWTDPDGEGDATYFGYDAFATIQEGIDAVEDGGTVNVAAGTYTEDLLVEKTLELAGADKETTIIKGVATVPAVNWPLADANIEILASGVKIHGFLIQSPNYVSGNYSSGIVIGAPDVEIYDNNFQTNAVNSLDDISQTIQTYAESAMPGVNVSGLNIHDNAFIHQGAGDWGYEGIYINPQDTPLGTVIIQDNQFSGKIVRAITTERSKTTIAGNTIITDQIPSDLSTAGSWRGVQISNAAESDVLISGNTITGSTQSNGFHQGILVKSAGGVTLSEKNVLNGNTIAVQNDDTVNILNAVQNYWGTAVEATIDGMIVGSINFMPYYVDSGMEILSNVAVDNVYVDATYTDGNAGTHIFGYDAFATIQEGINAVEAGGTVSVAGGTYGENITIDKDISLIGSGDTAVVEPSEDTDGVTVTVDGVLLKDFKVSTSNSGSTANIAIAVKGANNLTINNVTVETTGDTAMGIWVGGSSNSLDPVAGLIIIDSNVTVAGEATGIYAAHSSSAHSGWLIGGADNGNTITVENGNPLELYDVTSSEVSHNTLTTSALGGSAVIWSSELSSLSNLIFSNNTINFSGGSQVSFLTDFILNDSNTTVSGVTVSGNTFNNWGSRGLRIGSGVSGVTVSGNSFLHDGEVLKNESTTSEVNAEGNWWGQETGPAEGVIVGDVDYRPWHTTAAMTELDETAPTVSITSLEEPGPTNVSLIPVAVTFSEDVTGFEEGDIALTGGTIASGSFAGSGASYAFDVTPNAEGSVTINIAVDVAWDLAGNFNTAADPFTIVYDTTAPTATLTGAPTDTTNSTTADITVAGTDVTHYKYKLDDDLYGEETPVATHITLSGLTDGSHTVSVIGRDAAGNYQEEGSATTATWTVDATAPVAPVISSIAGDDFINNAEKAAIIVIGTAEVNSTVDVSLTGGVTVTGSGTADESGNYSISIDGTTLTDGTITASVTATDAVGNESNAGTGTATKDVVAPSVTSKTPSVNAVGVAPSSNITVTFNENVSIEDGNVAITPGNPAKSVTFDTSTNVATIDPADDLANNTKFTITLTGVTDTAGNALLGTDWSFTTAASYSMTLTTGWNLISLPVVPTNTVASAVLGDLDDASKIQSVFTYDAINGEWLVYHPDNPETSSFSTMTAGSGYWIDYVDAASAPIAGTGNLFLEGNNTPPQKELAAGWNLIGYFQLENETSVTADNALSTVADQWTQLRTYNNTSKVFQSVIAPDLMEPGQGFWIFMKSSSFAPYLYGPGDTD